MVILHHQIALGEATTLTLTGMNDQLCLLIVGENGHAFFNCDLHGVLKFSQVVGVVPWYLPLRFGRGAEVSPHWNLRGAHSPWNYKYL